MAVAAVRGDLSEDGLEAALEDVATDYFALHPQGSLHKYRDAYIRDLTYDPAAVGRVFLQGLPAPEVVPDHVITETRPCG